jgi:hypothetical protein
MFKYLILHFYTWFSIPLASFLSNYYTLICCFNGSLFSFCNLIHTLFLCYVNSVLILNLNLFLVDGPLTEQPSASFVSSKCTRMASTVTRVLTQKVIFYIQMFCICCYIVSWKCITQFLIFLYLQESVRCVASKFLTPSFINKATCSGSMLHFASSSRCIIAFLYI